MSEADIREIQVKQEVFEAQILNLLNTQFDNINNNMRAVVEQLIETQKRQQALETKIAHMEGRNEGFNRWFEPLVSAGGVGIVSIIVALLF